jgi:hypothetical protein
MVHSPLCVRAHTKQAFTLTIFSGGCERSQGKPIVHRVSDVLLATQVALGRLHRGVTEQELNLLKLTATGVTQLRACPSQVMRSDMVQSRSLGLRRIVFQQFASCLLEVIRAMLCMDGPLSVHEFQHCHRSSRKAVGWSSVIVEK